MDKTHDPRHLDVKAFAQAQAQLQGQSALTHWPRLAEEQLTGVKGEAPVRWSLSGRTQAEAGGPDEVWLELSAEAALTLSCQRCLAPVLETVCAERGFRFVADEATAEALDDEAEEDILVLDRDFDALALIEDELILSLPLVPRHDVCPEPLPQPESAAEGDPQEAQPHPFAALAALKKRP
jgi:uncharacterized protein